MFVFLFFFFFKQKTAYEMRISDWSSDVCSSDLVARQNLYGSVAWHLLMTPLAAFGLVAPWLAAITMLLSSLAVAANSWRLYRKYTRPHGGWQAAAEIGRAHV